MSTDRPSTAGRADTVRLHEGLYRLPAGPDPSVVFGGVARLLVPAVCDEASAEVLVGDRLVRWQQNPPITDGIPAPGPPRSATDGGVQGRSVTVYVGGLPAESDGWTGDLDYVAGLTCRWSDDEDPAESTVALIRIVARHAAVLVHLAQQAELIGAQESRIRRLERERSRRF